MMCGIDICVANVMGRADAKFSCLAQCVEQEPEIEGSNMATFVEQEPEMERSNMARFVLGGEKFGPKISFVQPLRLRVLAQMHLHRNPSELGVRDYVSRATTKIEPLRELDTFARIR